MKKVLLFALILLAAVSCKKTKNDPVVDPSDPGTTTDLRDAIVGDYTVTISGVLYVNCDYSAVQSMLPDSIPFNNKTFDLKIAKDSSDAAKTKMKVTSNLYNCDAYVINSSTMMFESSTRTDSVKASDFIESSLLEGITLPVTYTLVHKTATIKDGTITWHTDATGSSSISIATIAINFSGTAKIENSAIKKEN